MKCHWFNEILYVYLLRCLIGIFTRLLLSFQYIETENSLLTVFYYQSDFVHIYRYHQDF